MDAALPQKPPLFPRHTIPDEYAGLSFFIFSLFQIWRYNMNRRLFFGIASIAVALALPVVGFADTHTWQGPTGGTDYNWSTAANWTPAGPPASGTSGDTANITNGTTAEFSANGGARYMYLGGANGGSGGLHITAGTFSGGSYFEVGHDIGNGTLTQDGGTISMPNHFYVGARTGPNPAPPTYGTGNYYMNNGNLNVGGTFAVGSLGQGTIIQTGGTISQTNAAGSIGIGSTLGGVLGTWDMTGGVLNGPSGTGYVRVVSNQSGVLKARGTATVNTGNLVIGNNASTATVPLTGDIYIADTAQVSVTNSFILNDAAAVTPVTATVHQSGGMLTVGTLIRGAGVGATEYDLSGGSLNITGTTASTIGTLHLLPGTGGSGGTITSPTSTLTANFNYDAQAGIVNAVLAGSVGLDKSGPGLVQLMLANTYTGNTTITGGILDLFGGSITSHVSVSGTGSTLKGSGSVVGDVNAAAGSVIEPGDSIGTLTLTGNVALGGTLDVEYDGAAAGQKIDLLAVTGDLDLTGATFAFAPATGGSPLSGDGPFVFATYTGALTGSAGGTAPAGYEVDYGTPGQIALVVIPEPSTWILLVLGGMALAAYKRRRG
jgi:fibronectin-binding autotransporter adhesin